MVVLGGGLSSAEVLSATTGRTLNSGISGDRAFKLSTVSHMLDTELGWRISLWRSLSLRVAIGAAFTVAASSDAQPDWAVPNRSKAAVEALARSTETFLNDTLTQYVHTGTLTVALGWRL